MLERPNKLLPKHVLLEEIWRGATVDENSLNQVVSWLRRALDDGSARHGYIETVAGVGYRFVKSVTVSKQDES